MMSWTPCQLLDSCITIKPWKGEVGTLHFCPHVSRSIPVPSAYPPHFQPGRLGICHGEMSPFKEVYWGGGGEATHPFSSGLLSESL